MMMMINATLDVDLDNSYEENKETSCLVRTCGVPKSQQRIHFSVHVFMCLCVACFMFSFSTNKIKRF